jgi:hypothetical protein
VRIVPADRARRALAVSTDDISSALLCARNQAKARARFGKCLPDNEEPASSSKRLDGVETNVADALERSRTGPNEPVRTAAHGTGAFA